MSATLYALVIWQGASGLAFQPGYTSKEECQAVYQGPHVICWQYDPNMTTWTAFFRTTEGPGSPKGFGAIWRFPNESVCQNYINALKSEAYGACRQLPHPEPCPVACRAPEPPAPTPPPPPAAPPPPPAANDAPKPHPASLRLTYRSGQDCRVGWSPKQCTAYRLEAIQLAGGHYEPGFRWVSDDSIKVKDADKPYLESTVVETPKLRTAVRSGAPQQPQQQFDPVGAFIGLVTAPIRFATYPGRRDDW